MIGYALISIDDGMPISNDSSSKFVVYLDKAKCEMACIALKRTYDIDAIIEEINIRE